jgi:putative pre-16S rRNA nuclease
MGRVLALDYGTKRTGIAITDEMQLIASGLTTVATKELISFIKNYCETEMVDCIIVGEPKQRDGLPSQVEGEIQKFLGQLSQSMQNVTIHRVDERFTSKMAFQTMIDSGLKKKQRQNKALIDEISATILLQDYLNRKK